MADMTLAQLQALVEQQGAELAKLKAAAAAATPAPTEYYTLTKTGEEIDEILAGGGGVEDAVRYDEAQSLTTDQQAQARSNIGAAPSGYGLGTSDGKVIASDVDGGLNTAQANGWYTFGGDGNVENRPNFANSGYGALLVTSRYGFVQQKYLSSIVDSALVRRLAGTNWTEWEWVNPPMQLGVEYRTTERYLGQPVYTKLVDCGALPNAARKTVNHGATVKYMLRCAANCTAGYLDSLPYWYDDADYCTVYASTTQIIFKTPKDLSNRTANAQIWYTKPDA